MTDPIHDPPPALAERLRNTSDHLASSRLAAPDTDRVHDLLREAAHALEEMEGSIALSHRQTGALAAVKSAEETREVLLAILGPDHAQDRDLPLSMLAKVAAQVMGMRGDALATCRETVAIQEQDLAMLQAQADPPNRAPLLAAMEERLDNATLAQPTAEVLKDAIAAIRTDARVIEAAREKLKGWHAWARKIGRAEGDEYASAMPATLQARISGQVEAGQLALLVAPIRRRVEIVLALCADMGLGGPEAAELAPKAALWSDADVAEIEAFRVRDWSGTNINPFDHLPPALERTIYPGPGGRRAYLKRAGEPLPEPAAERQLGLPGLPKPETALRLRLALIDKPDGPLSALVAGFAQALLEKLDKTGIDRENAHAWMEDGWADTLRRALREHVEKGDPRDVAAYSAFAWHHGWSLAASDADRKREFFRKLQDSETARDHHADLRYAMGHATRKPPIAEVEQTHTDLQRMAGAGPLQLSEGADDLVATCLWELLEAIEKTDPTDTEMSKVQFRGTVRELAHRRHDLMSEVAVRESGGRVLDLALDSDAVDQRPAPSDPPSPPGYTPWISMGNSGWALDGVRVADDVIGAWAHYAGLWTSWARELAGYSDGTDEELRGYIARLVGRLHALRAQDLAKLDSPQ